MVSNAFVCWLVALHPYSKRRMLLLVESKDQGACSEMSRKHCIALVEVLHMLQGTALDAPWALLICGEICVCSNCFAVSISVVGLLWILIRKYSMVEDLHNLGLLCGSARFLEHT